MNRTNECENKHEPTLLKSLTKINLFFSTAFSFLLTRAIFSPTFLTFFAGLPASELVHILGFLQASNLYFLHWCNQKIFDGIFAKFLLFMNFYCFFKQLRAFKDLLHARNDFRVGLSKGKVTPVYDSSPPPPESPVLVYIHGT